MINHSQKTKGRLVTRIKGEIKFDEVVHICMLLNALSWVKEAYKDYTMIHYLDGSVKGKAKNGFTLSDLEIEYTPLSDVDMWTYERSGNEVGSKQYLKKQNEQNS